MNRVRTAVLTACVLLAVVAALFAVRRAPRPAPVPTESYQIRRVLLREIQPVKVVNCELERFGEANDGGYLLCANLLRAAKSGYSYGISGYDGWGCDISRKLGIPVHQYDCFDPKRPICEGGNTTFHGECIGATTRIEEGRPFDTLANQIAKNGDAGKHLVVKMDVEGAEWDTFITASDDTLRRIDQLTVEFHGFDQARYITAVRRLKAFFHLAHLHWNNYSCVHDKHPFPAWAYEVLFVNKKIAVADPAARVTLPHPLDAPNHPARPECVAPAAGAAGSGGDSQLATRTLFSRTPDR